MSQTQKELSKIALWMRRRILKSAWQANGGHIAPAYSIVEILTVLFFDEVLKYNPKLPSWDERDYLILSKGHGALALYSALAKAGYFAPSLMDNFCKPASEFGSLAKKGGVPGVEASTGSLGHGLSYAVGISLANKIDKKGQHTYVILGDGECEEGSVWEALMSAAHYKLSNMTIIIDNNGFQAMDDIKNILSFDNIADRISNFGFEVREINGHDFSEIRKALTHRGDRPICIIAHTIKGKGLSFMENAPIWHYRVPDEQEIIIALNELGMTREELGNHENCLFRNII